MTQLTIRTFWLNSGPKTWPHSLVVMGGVPSLTLKNPEECYRHKLFQPNSLDQPCWGANINTNELDIAIDIVPDEPKA